MIFNDFKDLNDSLVEMVDTLNVENHHDRIGEQTYETSAALNQNEIMDFILEEKIEPVVVCQVIIQILEEQDAADLELKFISRILHVIKPLNANTILLFEIDMSLADNHDKILGEIRNDELVMEAEWNKKMKKR